MYCCRNYLPPQIDQKKCQRVAESGTSNQPSWTLRSANDMHSAYPHTTAGMILQFITGLLLDWVNRSESLARAACRHSDGGGVLSETSMYSHHRKQTCLWQLMIGLTTAVTVLATAPSGQKFVSRKEMHYIASLFYFPTVQWGHTHILKSTFCLGEVGVCTTMCISHITPLQGELCREIK